MKKVLASFRVGAFGIALLASCVVAGVVAWIFKLNFWIVVAIVFVALLINGLIAAVEDGDKNDNGDSD